MMEERTFNVPKKVVGFDATSLTTFVIKSYDSISCLQRLVFFYPCNGGFRFSIWGRRMC
ncbi:Uncharacterised protein [Porphyromonas cangingivalis]|nr:Uncharacterised protein [Porphyromonas cangingivalis]